MRLLSAALFLCASTASANTCGPTYTIASGDTLSGIAARCGVPLETLFAANPDVDARDLSIGDTLNLSGSGENGDAFARYLTDYLGAYAPTQTCFGQEIQVDLTEDGFFFGETGCDLAGVATSGQGLVLNAVSCQSEGEPAGDALVEVLRDGTALNITFRGSTRRLERCTDR